MTGKGGEHAPVELVTGEQMLLSELWKHLGGPSLLAEISGMHRQSFINWKLRGQVPLEHTVYLADKFNIPMWGLNYIGLSKLFPDVPKWEKVVNSYGFNKETVAKILKLKPPKVRML